MFPSTTTRNIFWITFALGFGWALYRLFASTGYILDDEPTHFLRSKSVWVNPDLLFDGWTRIGRNLIHAPFAPLGISATRIVTLLLASLSVWLTAKSAKHIGIKSIWAIPVLMFFQSWFPDLSYSVLTQTPFMLIWILGIYLSQKQRLYLASMCFGYLSFIRHEGILLTGLWGIWISFQKGGILHGILNQQFIPKAKSFKRDGVLAFFTVLPILIINIADFIYFRNIEKIPFMVYFDSNPTDYYGSGPIYHYAMLLIPALGLVSLSLALFGAFFIKKELSKWSLILFTYVSYFVVHSLIFWSGTFASGGYFHFLMPMAPIFALLAAKAFDVISGKWARLSKPIIITALTLVTYQGIHMIQQQGMYQDWEGIRAGTASYKVSFINPPQQPHGERIHLREAMLHLETIRKNELVVSNHAALDDHFGYLETKDLFQRRSCNVNDLPKNCFFIWDQKLSELNENQRHKHFKNDHWEVVRSWKSSSSEAVKKNPEKEYTVIIFKKVK